ncbi:hypothetical protein QP695_05960 [Lactobacillus iners]|uniref:hypothetical protein n=1 Tax=Lactobacillus iners TaxID=147802 RepID=UPI002551836A|nr:hypothetical protein [Lactobacillus iners]MCT7839229.1 hypothetical protein [Lactobacillus iners]MDK8132052.1 hypothetical protein [Lactobacillus iners]
MEEQKQKPFSAKRWHEDASPDQIFGRIKSKKRLEKNKREMEKFLRIQKKLFEERERLARQQDKQN